MKQIVVRRILGAGLLTILVGVMVHAPLSVGLGTVLPGYALEIKAWKELVMVVLVGLAIVLVLHQGRLRHLYNDWIVRLMLAYAALHLMLLPLFWQGLLPSIAGLMIDLRFIVFFLLCYIYAQLEPNALRQFLLAGTIGLAVVVGFGLLQITVLPADILTHIGYGKETIAPYTTIDTNSAFIRINSTLRGPNPLGALMVIAVSGLVAWWMYARRTLTRVQQLESVAALMAVGAVLVASYSRSAYLAAVVAFAVLMYVSYGKVQRRHLAAAIGVGGVMIVAAYGIQHTSWYQNVILHESPTSTVVRKSNDEHVRSLSSAASLVANHPLGTGVGSTGSAGLYGSKSTTMVENYFLFVALESGWLGLGLFGSATVLVLRRLWQYRREWHARAMLASGLAMLVIGLLLPVWADDTVALVWWGMTGGVLGHFLGQSRQQ